MVGIMSAMQEEIQELLNHLVLKSTTIKGKRTYYQGTLFKKEVIIVFSRWGKVSAAITATQLINDFNIDELIFTGVAGALKDELVIGDIIIGKNLFQHDLDARPLVKQFEVPLLNKLYFSTSNSTQLINATHQFINQYNQFITSEHQKKFSINKPTMFYEDIASGDKFISSNSMRNQIIDLLPNAFCVEMEGAAVAQVCFEYEIPFSIIRIISDNASHGASINFPLFVNSIASHYALGIFKNYFSKY